MRCRHCGQGITFAYNGSGREWVHNRTGRSECIIAGADVGTTADPQDGDTLTDAEAQRDAPPGGE